MLVQTPCSAVYVFMWIGGQDDCRRHNDSNKHKIYIKKSDFYGTLSKMMK